MRSIILILLSLSLSVAACSKKGGTTVVTPPPAPAPNPNPSPNPGVDPYSTNHDLRKDNIRFDKTTAGWLDFNINASARVGYADLLHSAYSYFASYPYNNSTRYGANNGFDYSNGVACNTNFLDRIYDRFYNADRPIHDMDFADCAEYFDYLDELAEGEIYVEMKQYDGNIVEGNIHAAVYVGPPYYYVSQFVIPYRGKISKDTFAAPVYRHFIKIGSALSIFTNDSTVTDPNDRELGIEFDATDIGSLVLGTP
jgi:hypothetical protein